jgi:hypothetical protein
MQDEYGRPKGRKRKKMAWADLEEKKALGACRAAGGFGGRVFER